MAIAIKNIPILKDKAAQNFEKKAIENATLQTRTSFEAEIALAKKILAKAKIK